MNVCRKIYNNELKLKELRPLRPLSKQNSRTTCQRLHWPYMCWITPIISTKYSLRFDYQLKSRHRLCQVPINISKPPATQWQYMPTPLSTRHHLRPIYICTLPHCFQHEEFLPKRTEEKEPTLSDSELHDTFQKYVSDGLGKSSTLDLHTSEGKKCSSVDFFCKKPPASDFSKTIIEPTISPVEYRTAFFRGLQARRSAVEADAIVHCSDPREVNLFRYVSAYGWTRVLVSRVHVRRKRWTCLHTDRYSECQEKQELHSLSWCIPWFLTVLLSWSHPWLKKLPWIKIFTSPPFFLRCWRTLPVLSQNPSSDRRKSDGEQFFAANILIETNPVLALSLQFLSVRVQRSRGNKIATNAEPAGFENSE